MSQEMDLATRLGKQAAAVAYQKPYLSRPKQRRTTSHSRTFKVGPKKSDEETAAQDSTGNVQPPYRYGRRLK